MFSVYRRKRRTSAGKISKAATYTGRFKLPGDKKPRVVALRCRDEQVARQRLREIVLQAERERAGLAVPVADRECLARSLSELAEEFIAEKERIGRAESYTRILAGRLAKLAEDCAWRTLRDISAADFMSWRSRLADSPKTLNEYLRGLRGFLEWVSKRYRLPRLPFLDGVELIDERGQETFERRALTLQEAQRLLNVAPPGRRLIYVLALATGLRRAELDSLVWGDVHLDTSPPFLQVRAKHTKNRKDAFIPLIPQAAGILQAVRPSKAALDRLVIPGGVPRNRRALRRDMQAAGILVMDANGRKFDFHALRTTACTFLLQTGAPARIVQEIMRHSDIRLTTKNYADMSRIPLHEAMQPLGRLLSAGEGGGWTPEWTLLEGKSCHFASEAVLTPENRKPAKHPENIGNFADCHGVSESDAHSRMVEAEGLEPTTH
jgi:integrase